MVINKIKIAILVCIAPMVSQGQLSLGISSGIRMSFSKIILENSPKNTFRIAHQVTFPNMSIQLNYNHNKNIYGFDFERNNVFLSAADRSKNILFFPDLENGRGTILNNGGRAITLNIKYGRQFTKNKWNFNLMGQVFYSKFQDHFETGWGVLAGELDSAGNKKHEWSFLEWGDVRYYNNLQTFGLGLKLEIEYNVFHNFYLSLSNEVNKGFFKVMEKDYRTSFWSIDEPEKNATYFNSTAHFGSNYKCFIGLKYVFKKKQDRPED